MSQETYRVCPRCDNRVEPQAPGVHFGREWRLIQPGVSNERVPATGAWYHPDCSLLPGWTPEALPEHG